ncbi:hypothetical protein [Amycolatopsis suaedae]|uniref:Uncharacterized protein n=1 Tax=Amycolatopsis suaedae TaxID=2510978 RepID=A0A4V2EMN6_9PSEU|nr:hypothetical protein [Amycolatopsis suaedae]RZQ65735.1 hypothetical protein EWH70_01200 [Amycolatopsis suaedae]
MTPPGGYSVQVAALRRVASNTEGVGLPAAAGTLRTASESMRDLYVQPAGAFGADGSGIDLGQKRNRLIAAIISGGLAITESIEQTAERLDVIADAYERIERQVTGEK